MKPAALITFVFVATISFAGDKLKSQIKPVETALIKANNQLNPSSAIGLFGDKKDKDKKGFKNRRLERPIGVNLMGFGPAGLAGLSIDGFLGPKFAIEAGAGLRNQEGDFNYFVGGRYHILGGTFLNLTPYVGAYTTFHYNGRDVQNNSVYFPIGLHKIKKNGFSWSAELAYRKSVDTPKNLHGAFKIGYRF